MKAIHFFIIGLICVIFATSVYSQTDGGVKIMPKQGELYDSVKKMNNPYILPIGGKKLGEKGFLLPYPIGVMINSYVGTEDVTISNLAVGLNDNPMIPLDDVVGFSKVSASVQTINSRVDLWLLPFLDIYGIFGKTWVQTDVGIGSILNNPVSYETEADFDGYTYGVGAMLTGGIRSIFFSLDASKIWSHFDQMKTDNSAVNMGLRTGYIFHFQNNPEKNLSVWTGATRLFLSNTTEGTIKLSDIMPDMGTKYQDSEWYKSMIPPMQGFVDELVTKSTDKLSKDEIHYTLQKRPTHDWAMVLGAQFQLDRHWQFRFESNFLGGRKSALISANYRFGLF